MKKRVGTRVCSHRLRKCAGYIECEVAKRRRYVGGRRGQQDSSRLGPDMFPAFVLVGLVPPTIKVPCDSATVSCAIITPIHRHPHTSSSHSRAVSSTGVPAFTRSLLTDSFPSRPDLVTDGRLMMSTLPFRYYSSYTSTTGNSN